MQKIGSFVGKVTNLILHPESAIPAILLGTVTLLTVSGALVVLALFSPILAYVLLAVAAIVGLLACISFIRHCRSPSQERLILSLAEFKSRLGEVYEKHNQDSMDASSDVDLENDTVIMQHIALYDIWQENVFAIIDDVIERKTFSYDASLRDIIYSREHLVDMLQCFSGITSLKLFRLMNCRFFDENCCQTLVRQFPALQHLVLASKNQINDSFLKHISKLKSLTVLDLAGCPNITGAALLSCVKKCPNLEELFLPESDGIGEGDVIKLITRMPALGALNIPENRCTEKVWQVAEKRGILVRNSTSSFSPVKDASDKGDPNAAGGQINPL
jgi:membrane protein implicated in regulation of membrane protease activity